MRRFVGVLIGFAAIGVVSSAMAAGDFGSSGQFAVGIERAFGVYGYKVTDHWFQAGQGNNVGDYENSVSGTTWNVLWGRSGDVLQYDPLLIPRVGFDYFVADHWSVGGSLGYMSSSGEVNEETRPPGHILQRQNLPDISIYAIAPRAGFAYMFTKVVGIWPRAGFTWLHADAKQRDPNQTTEVTYNLFNLDLECHLVIAPVEHVAITVGPVVDIGLTGGYETKEAPPPNQPEPDHDLKLHNYGIAAGLLAYF